MKKKRKSKKLTNHIINPTCGVWMGMNVKINVKKASGHELKPTAMIWASTWGR